MEERVREDIRGWRHEGGKKGGNRRVEGGHVPTLEA